MKKKKYQRGGFEQGFRAREDESLGMRTGPERAKLQDMAARRADSYGAWGRRPNQMINRDVGGTAEEHKAAKTSKATQELTRAQLKKAWKDLQKATSDSNKTIEKKFKEKLTPIKITATKLLTKVLGEGARTISDADRALADKIAGEMNESSRTISNADRKRLQMADPQSAAWQRYNQNAKGGVASFARGGVERAGEEGSRLSVSMEKQEDAGFSPSEADFREQHKLALEGVMDVGADVTIVQGHNSREQLGETDGVRGGGAAIRGKNFRGVN